jgi:hypothetical protein
MTGPTGFMSKRGMNGCSPPRKTTGAEVRRGKERMMGMEDTDAIQMMARCRDEIKHLRRINADLAPKADAYDNLAIVLNLLPRPSQGMTEDLVWRLDREIEEIKARRAKAAESAATEAP